MDNLPTDQPSKSQVLFTSTPFYKRKIFWLFIIFILILILIPAGLYIYKNIPRAKKLTLSCPVPQQYCNQAKQIKYNSQPALLYQLPSGTQITAAAPVVDSVKVITKGKSEFESLRQTFIINNQCYTLTYTFPSDAQIAKIQLLPLDVGTSIATTSASLLTFAKEQANLILQLQKRGMDPNTVGKPDFQRCTAVNTASDQIGKFQQLDLSIFR